MRELQLYIENDSRLYHRMTKPIETNLKKKLAKRTYDPAKAEVAFGHLMDAGAKA